MSTKSTNYSDAYIEYGAVYFASLVANNQWQRELDFRQLDRYSAEAKGEDGSLLRNLHLRKLDADEELQRATERLRQVGTAMEVQAVEAMREVSLTELG